MLASVRSPFGPFRYAIMALLQRNMHTTKVFCLTVFVYTYPSSFLISNPRLYPAHSSLRAG